MSVLPATQVYNNQYLYNPSPCIYQHVFSLDLLHVYSQLFDVVTFVGSIVLLII